MPTDQPATAAGLPGNYCKVPGCTEPFAYDHRCERHSDDDDPDTAAPRCCCIGMIGNTHYMCLGRGLDIGHCRGECPSYPECVEANDAIRRDAESD